LLYNLYMPEWLGKTIGKVRIDKYLARGGMAEVYLGMHLTLDRPVAIKVLHSYIEEEPDLLVRFQREAKVVAGLRHPNIVQIYDFDAIDGHPYIVMEYLKGPSLATYLRGLHKRNERIPHHQVARLLKALTASLDYAHEQGVIHRDIKPGNILLHGKADEIPLDQPLTSDVEAVLTDFGLVRIANSASQTASGMVSGTPAYMSPEQARGDQTDHRTDIYSLGIVLYEMLAGRVPFEADSTLSVIYKQINDPPPPIPGISPAVQRVIDRALAKKPEERYPTSRNMAVDFFLAIGMTAEAETIINALPEASKTIIGALPNATSKPVDTNGKPKPSGRKPARIGLGILSVIGLFALAIGAFFIFSKSSISSNATDIQNPEATVPTENIVTSRPPGLPDANDMSKIAAGTYEVGSSSADNFHSASMSLLLNDFWIDKYQTTNAQYEQFVKATGAQPPEITGTGNQPVRGVTWDQAAAYCSWVNKRMPTEAEWEAAGRGSGPNPQLYPWGKDPTADGNVAKLPSQDTYEVGTLPFNKSPNDVYDMVGNIWEWVGEPYASTPAGMKILRGGRFDLPILELSYRLPATSDDARYVKFAGFRCAADKVK
jgi:serine/threonine-protein kinase